MALLDRLGIELDLQFSRLASGLAEADRQAAWRLYCEISTRTALIGKPGDSKADDFSGEVWVESIASIAHFYEVARAIMADFPVGSITIDPQERHLGNFVHDVLTAVLRPFLERWHARYQWWWEHESDRKLEPFKRQAAFPNSLVMLRDWAEVRRTMRAALGRAVETYELEPARD